MTIPRRRKPKAARKPVPMSQEQFRTALATLGLSQRDGARFLDVNERTLRRWALGERQVDAFMAKVLRYMVAHDLKPGDLDRVGPSRKIAP